MKGQLSVTAKPFRQRPPSIASFVAFWQQLRDGASRCATDATHEVARRISRYERPAVANAQPRRTSSRSHPPTIPISPPDSKHKSAMSAMLQDPQRSRSSPTDSRVRKPIPTILHDGSILLDRPILLERYSIAHLHTSRCASAHAMCVIVHTTTKSECASGAPT